MNFEFKFGMSNQTFAACCFTIGAVVVIYGAAKIKGL